MPDFSIKVGADTKNATKALKGMGKALDNLKKSASKFKIPSLDDLERGYDRLNKDVKTATNSIKLFHRVSMKMPGPYKETASQVSSITKGLVRTVVTIDRNNSAAEILSNTFGKIRRNVVGLVSALAKIGFALFAIKEITGVVQAAWKGFFNETVGREIQLRQTLLKTQTALASTTKVFKDGKEITDPYTKIVTLTSEVGKNIDSIRERSIALAGVTSGQVIEVFGLVAQQISSIGGSLKDAEDLAISFSAALGTFGIPMYQARQEIGSILRGDITMDSYLAKSLGITNEDIAKAKGDVGGVVKFLEDRLSAAVAGQRIAAKGFAGVTSNIADLWELIGQKFGAGLLDPLLDGLTLVFDRLFSIKDVIFDIARSAGNAVGQVGGIIASGASATIGATQLDYGGAVSGAKDAARNLTGYFSEAAVSIATELGNAFKALQPSLLIIVDGMKELAQAFVGIRVQVFKSLASALAIVASALSGIVEMLSGIFNMYAQFLNNDVVKYISSISMQMGILKRFGLDLITNMILAARVLVTTIIPALGVFGTVIATLLTAIGGLIIGVASLAMTFAGLAAALVTPAIAIPGLAAALTALSTQLTSVAAGANAAGGQVNSLATKFGVLGGTARAAGMAMIKALGIVALVQIGITVAIDAFGKWRREQQRVSKQNEAILALNKLAGAYRDVTETSDEASQAAKRFAQTIADQAYSEAKREIDEIEKKIARLRETLDSPLDPRVPMISGTLMDAPRNSALLQQAFMKGDIKSLLRAKEIVAKYEAAADKKRLDRNITMEKKNKVRMEKVIEKMRREQESTLFAKRMSNARKEIEVYKLRGQIAISQADEVIRNQIKGEEGIERAGLERLRTFLVSKKRGELDIEARKRELSLRLQELEKGVADYKYAQEKKIYEMRKKMGEYEAKLAEFKVKKSEQEQKARTGTTGSATGRTGLTQGATGSSPDISGPHYHVDANWPITEAEARAMFVGGRDFTKTSQPGDGRSNGRVHNGWDFAAPGGTSHNLDLAPGHTMTNFTRDGGLGGNFATILLDISKGLNEKNQPKVAYIRHLSDPGTGWKMPPLGPEAPKEEVLLPPELPKNLLAGMEGEHTAKYEKLSNALGGLITQIDNATTRLKEVTNANELNRLMDAMFPKPGKQGLKDSIASSQSRTAKLLSRDPGTTSAGKVGIEAQIENSLEALKRANRTYKEKVQEFVANGTIQAEEAEKYIETIALRFAEATKAATEFGHEQIKALGADVIENYVKATLESVETINLQTDAIKLRDRLQAEGMNEHTITAELAKAAATEEYRKALMDANTELERKQALETLNAKKGAIDENKEAKIKASDPVNNLMKQWASDLKDFRGMIAELAQTIQQSLSSAMASAIGAMISGTGELKDIFANMFESIGQAFIKMATDMITKWLLMKAIGLVASAFGGGGAGPTPNVSLDGANSIGLTAAPGLAMGGPVTQGQPYVVGERGPELFVPQGSSGKIVPNHALNAYSPGNSNSYGPGQVPVNMSYSGPQLNFNGDEYLPKSAIPELIATAAREGAKQGQARTMKGLRNNRSQRATLGMS